MRRILAWSLALLLSGCTAAAPAPGPHATTTEPGAGNTTAQNGAPGDGTAAARSWPEPKLPLLVDHHLGELREVEHGEGLVRLLPARPKLVARVRGAAGVHWLVYQDSDARSTDEEPLAVLDGEAVATDRWELNWIDAPTESVRLVLCAVPKGDFPAGEGVPLVGGRPCLVLDEKRVLTLGPDESPYITEEEAMSRALRWKPDAPWLARFVESYTRFGLVNARGQPAWVLEALYPYGNRQVFVIDALTGEQITVGFIEPPHFGREPVPLSQKEAVASALAQLGDSGLRLVEATYTDQYEWRGHTYLAWVLRLASGPDVKDEITAVIHAYTGHLLIPSEIPGNVRPAADAVRHAQDPQIPLGTAVSRGGVPVRPNATVTP